MSALDIWLCRRRANGANRSSDGAEKQSPPAVITSPSLSIQRPRGGNKKGRRGFRDPATDENLIAQVVSL